MRVVVQRVKLSKVSVENKLVGEIGKGFNVLVGVETSDTLKDVDYIKNKLLSLRVFEDENGKLNLSIKDIGGSMLLVSQFTLLGDVRKGNRPSFINAARPEVAKPLFDDLVSKISKEVKVETGIFQTDMLVEILNDGPTTILIDSNKTF